MQEMIFDIHLHSIASGHGTTDTIADLAKCAKKIGLQMIGIADHGPATMLSGTVSYFRSLSVAPRFRCGIELLYGVELNILNYEGLLDLEETVLNGLDYAIASMHLSNISPGTKEQNTAAYIGAMKHPRVKIIGHCDDTHFPVDFDALVKAALQYGALPEINNSSLSPDGYRGNTQNHNLELLSCCKRYNCPVVLGSDSHGSSHVGDFRYATALLNQADFPFHLVLNSSVERFKKFIK